MGIVIDEKQQLTPLRRQSLATNLGFDETVFINDLKSADVSIYNLQHEVSFAGHALLGTAWFIEQLSNRRITNLRCRGRSIHMHRDLSLIWLTADKSLLPHWKIMQLNSPEQIDALRMKGQGLQPTLFWAWVNQNASIIRARHLQ